MIEFVNYFKNYIDYSGKISRRQFWMTIIQKVLVVCSAYLLLNLTWDLHKINLLLSFVPGVISIALALWVVATIIPDFSMGTRRFNDIGLNWKFWSYILYPVVGPILLIIFFCFKSKEKHDEADEPTGGEFGFYSILLVIIILANMFFVLLAPTIMVDHIIEYGNKSDETKVCSNDNFYTFCINNGCTANMSGTVNELGAHKVSVYTGGILNLKKEKTVVVQDKQKPTIDLVEFEKELIYNDKDAKKYNIEADQLNGIWKVTEEEIILFKDTKLDNDLLSLLYVVKDNETKDKDILVREEHNILCDTEGKYELNISAKDNSNNVRKKSYDVTILPFTYKDFINERNNMIKEQGSVEEKANKIAAELSRKYDKYTFSCDGATIHAVQQGCVYTKGYSEYLDGYEFIYIVNGSKINEIKAELAYKVEIEVAFEDVFNKLTAFEK